MRTVVILTACVVLCATVGCANTPQSITARTVRVTWEHDGTSVSVTGMYDLWAREAVDVKVVGEWDERVVAQFNKEADRQWALWNTTIAAVAAGAKELLPLVLKGVMP